MLTDTPLTRIPLVFDSLLTLFLFVLAAGLGRRLLRLFSLRPSNTLEHGLFAATLGLGVLSYLPFTLFATGLGRPPVVVGATILLALLLLPDEIRVLLGAARAATDGFRAWVKSGLPWTTLLFIVMAALLMIAGLKALCPCTDADGLHYHLTAPQRYLTEGRFVYMPTFLHIHWPLSVEMLFGIGLAFHHYYATGLIHFGFGILLLLATYALGRRITTPAVGWLGAGLLLSQMYILLSLSYIDLGLALYVLMSLTACFLAWQSLSSSSRYAPEWGLPAPPSDSRARWMRLSAILAGMAATSKLSGLLFLLLLAFMAGCLLHSEGEGSRLREGLTRGGVYLILGLATAAPWYLRTWALTGAPLYPYFWSLFGAKDWDAAASQRMNEYFHTLNSMRSLRPTPQMVLMARSAVCVLVALIGVALCRWRRTEPIRPLVVFCFAAIFLQIATSGIYYRFLLPMLPMLFLLFFWALRARLASGGAFAWGLTFLVLFMLLGKWRMPSTLRELADSARESLPVALGRVPREAYLSERIPIAAMLFWINRQLPEDITVVLGSPNDAYAALLERRSLCTFVWTQNALRFDEYSHLVTDLKRLGVTHLILNKTAFTMTPEQRAALIREDWLRATIEQPNLVRVSAEYGTVLHQEGDYLLYQLRLPP